MSPHRRFHQRPERVKSGSSPLSYRTILRFHLNAELALKTPAVAIAMAEKETIRMAQISLDMLNLSGKVLIEQENKDRYAECWMEYRYP